MNGVHHKNRKLHGKINPKKLTGRYCPLVMSRGSPIFKGRFRWWNGKPWWWMIHPVGEFDFRALDLFQIPVPCTWEGWRTKPLKLAPGTWWNLEVTSFQTRYLSEVQEKTPLKSDQFPIGSRIVFQASFFRGDVNVKLGGGNFSAIFFWRCETCEFFSGNSELEGFAFPLRAQFVDCN